MSVDVSVPCLCPERAGARPHPDGDTISLRDRLDFHGAMTIRKALILMRSDGEVLVAEALSSATELYLLFGIESWTLVDEKGRPLPPSQANIRAHLLTQLDAAITVADRADDLYTEAVVLPLLVEAASFSQPTPTIPPTSAPTPTSDSPMPFSPSSTITSPTADTATTTSPLVGVSS